MISLRSINLGNPHGILELPVIDRISGVARDVSSSIEMSDGEGIVMPKSAETVIPGRLFNKVFKSYRIGVASILTNVEKGEIKLSPISPRRVALSNEELGKTEIGVEYNNSTGPWTFSVDDFVNLPSFATKLKQPLDSISKYLRERCSDATRKIVDNYEPGSPAANRVRDALNRELNAIISGKLIYQEQRFANVKLSTTSEEFLKLKPQDDEELVCQNRLLIEDGYPLEIAKHAGCSILVGTDAWPSKCFKVSRQAKKVTVMNRLPGYRRIRFSR